VVGWVAVAAAVAEREAGAERVVAAEPAAVADMAEAAAAGRAAAAAVVAAAVVVVAELAAEPMRCFGTVRTSPGCDLHGAETRFRQVEKSGRARQCSTSTCCHGLWRADCR
jgi:hypothetical protein